MDEEFDKPKLRAARTTFLDNILQRSGTSRVQSARDEESTTRHPFYIHPDATAGMAPNIKRLKLFGSKSDDEEEANMPGPTRHKVPLLIRFYDPDIRGEDAVGRTLDEILAWEDSRLETCHNYIQMLFPLPEGSIFNIQAPIITREVMEAFRERDELKGRLRESFERILKFYGFKIKVEGEEDEVDDGETDEENEEREQPQSSEQADGDLKEVDLQETAPQPIDNAQTETANSTEVSAEPKTSISLEETESQAQNTADTVKVVQKEDNNSDSKQTTNVTNNTQIANETDHTGTANETNNPPTTNETNNPQTANETNNTPTTKETDNDQAMAEPSDQPVHTNLAASITQENNPQPTENLHTESKAWKTEPTGSNRPNRPQYQSLLPPHGCIIVRGPNWRRAFRNWAIRFDHNHLRMTRILRSLRVLGLQDECEAFYDALKEVFNDERIYINERTMIYWRQAVRNPLHIAPDGEQIPWLKKWAKKAA